MSRHLREAWRKLSEQLECQRLVTRQGGSGTPLSPVATQEPCGNPAISVLRDEDGSLLAYACPRHDDMVYELAEEFGLPVVSS